MKFLSSWSIRGKLLLLILIAVLPALGIILFSDIKHRENEIVSTKRDILHLVQSLAAQQEQLAAGTRQMLQTLAQLPEVQEIDAKACNELFKDIHEQNPIYSTISAATPDGNTFAASAPFIPGSVNLADRKHIRDAIRTRDFSAGEYIVGKVSRVPSINFTYPVLDKNGKLIAIMIAGLKLDKYNEFMEQLNLPKGSVMGITDRNYIILYRFPGSLDAPPGAPLPSKLLPRIPVDSKEGFLEVIGMDNVSRIYAYKRLWLRDNEPWYLGIYVGVDKNSVLHRANMELVYNLVFLGIACLFAMLSAWIAGNSIIVAPLNKLVIATQRFGEGEMHARADIPHREDELGRLGKSFDTMTVMLETKDLERREAEEKIKASLLEKETMLKEIHHRVKNNLQVISSLLNMQSSSLQDEKAKEALQESMARVRTMAMIHTQLYQSQDLTKIDFGIFIRDLIGNIGQSYGRAASPVELHVDADEIRLGIDTSIPCGLILNELVANALEHAFPEGKEGEINIRIRPEDNQMVLTVQDNGIGFPASIDFRKTQSLGLELVNILVGQMNGRIEMQVDGGTTWTIAFPVKNEREWRNG